MNSKIIAVDFDGTLCENKWPEIGEANEDMIYYLRKRQAEGDKLILWTCRVGDMLRKAINWCYNYGLIFNAVNENLPEIIDSFGSDTRKIFANEYIDDRNRLISSCREKSNMELWVENEVRIAWEHYSKPLEASPLMGGAPAGVFSKMFGIVEFSDGVRRVDPSEIVFCDEENEILSEMEKMRK